MSFLDYPRVQIIISDWNRGKWFVWVLSIY